MTLNIKDVREAMPNYDFYKDWHRSGDILGIAIHHSATANRLTGAPVGDAATFFNYHVNTSIVTYDTIIALKMPFVKYQNIS